jgi:hypothetical protein
MSNPINDDYLKTLLDEPGKRVDFNVCNLVVQTFVKEGLQNLMKPENVVGLFFGDDEPIAEAVRHHNRLIFDTFKTEEQVTGWRGYEYELTHKNPLAMILKLSGENPDWLG